jgi:hypothetical protein
VAASSDGRSLVVAAAALRVWPLAMDAWREQACAYAGRDLTADERSTYSPGDALPPLCP